MGDGRASARCGATAALAAGSAKHSLLMQRQRSPRDLARVHPAGMSHISYITRDAIQQSGESVQEAGESAKQARDSRIARGLPRPQLYQNTGSAAVIVTAVPANRVCQGNQSRAELNS